MQRQAKQAETVTVELEAPSLLDAIADATAEREVEADDLSAFDPDREADDLSAFDVDAPAQTSLESAPSMIVVCGICGRLDCPCTQAI